MFSFVDSGRRPSALVFVILVVLCAALWPSALAFDAYWNGLNDRAYGYLIVVMTVAWLVILRRDLDASPVAGQILALPLFLGAALVWLVAWQGNSDLIHQLLVLFIAFVAVWVALGRALALKVAPPIAYLIFALPIWDQIVPVLQRMTIVAAQFFMGLIDVAVSVSGSLVTIPEGTFTVQEGCSGKRYLMVTLALATIAAASNRLSIKRQVFFLFAAAVLAILANWIRVVIIIYAGHVTNMQHYFVAVEHLSLGYFIFAILLILVVVLAFRGGSRQLKESARLSATAVAAAASSALAVPASNPPETVRNSSKSQSLTILSLLVFIGAGVTCIALRDDATIAPVLGGLPVVAQRWNGPLPDESEWQPRFVGASDEQRARYATTAGDTENGDIHVYRNIYGTQRPGAELIYFENTLFAPGEWQQPSTNGLLTAIATTLGMAPATYVAISPQGHKWVMMHVYTVGNWRLRGQVAVQAAYGMRAIASAVPAGIIAIASKCSTECVSAERRVEEFWSEHRQALLVAMPSESHRPPNLLEL